MVSHSSTLIHLDAVSLRSIAGGADIDYTPFGSAQVIQPGGDGPGGDDGGHEPPDALFPEIVHILHYAHLAHSILKVFH